MKDVDSINGHRILARNMARELTAEETAMITGALSGGGTSITPTQTSTCSASDNNSCDLDTWGNQ